MSLKGNFQFKRSNIYSKPFVLENKLKAVELHDNRKQLSPFACSVDKFYHIIALNESPNIFVREPNLFNLGLYT